MFQEFIYMSDENAIEIRQAKNKEKQAVADHAGIVPECRQQRQPQAAPNGVCAVSRSTIWCVAGI